MSDCMNMEGHWWHAEIYLCKNKNKTKQNKKNNTDANKWRDINKIFNWNKNIQ